MKFDNTPGRFTERERDVLRLLVQGKSNREIAEELSIAEITVKNYLSHIFEKLGVSNRTQAVIRAMALGLVPLEPGDE